MERESPLQEKKKNFMLEGDEACKNLNGRKNTEIKEPMIGRSQKMLAFWYSGEG